LLKVGGADSVIPFSRGSELVDINPNKEKNSDNLQSIGKNRFQMPICGYKKIALSNYSSTHNTIKYRFIYKDGTYDSFSNPINNWTDWILIPQNALMCEIAYASGTYGDSYVYYALLS
jgi:hypothetical protein